MSENFYDLFVSLKKLNKIDISVKRNLELSGLDYSKVSLKKIQLIISNLEKLEQNYLKNTTNELVEHNKTKKLDDILVKFHKNLNANHPDAYLVTI